MAAEADRRRAERLAARHGRRAVPSGSIVSVVVGVGLVPLEHRELGVVLVGDALVAEVLAELVDALEAADDQALEVELGGDPQVEVGIELVRVRHERAGERAAVTRLEDRGLDLDEALVVERAADRRDHPRAEHEVAARLLVHEQVEVAAPVALLDVGQAVEGVGKRRPDPCEQLERVDRERRLAAPRLRRTADRRRRCRRGARRSRRSGRPGREAGCGRSGRRGRGTSASPCRDARGRGRRAGARSRPRRRSRAARPPRARPRSRPGPGSAWAGRPRGQTSASGAGASSRPEGPRRACGPSGSPRSRGARRRRGSPRCS